MKKIQFVSLVALMLLMGNSAMAQTDSKSEISISVGGGTPNERNIGEAIGEAFGSAIGKMLGYMITLGQVDLTDKTKKDESIGPAINLQYLYRVAPKWKIGASLTYQRTSTTLKAADKAGTYHDVAKATNDYFTVMPVVKAMWIEKNHIGLYSKAAAGICIANNDAKMVGGAKENKPGEVTNEIKSDKGTRFGYQISAIGFEAGSKNFRGFVELGYGFQGFAQLGATIKF
jgi:hypothetical protein